MYILAMMSTRQGKMVCVCCMLTFSVLQVSQSMVHVPTKHHVVATPQDLGHLQPRKQLSYGHLGDTKGSGLEGSEMEGTRIEGSGLERGLDWRGLI